jgi:hypothetical protein
MLIEHRQIREVGYPNFGHRLVVSLRQRLSMAYRLKMKNKVDTPNLTIAIVIYSSLDESHALLIRSGFLRQVLAPSLSMDEPTPNSSHD